MRPAHAKSVGKRRFAAAAAVLLEPPPVSETIDISTFSGVATHDITQIDAIDITKFNAISAYYDNAATTGSGSGVAKGIRVRPTGGSFLATGYQEIDPATQQNSSMIVQAAAGTPFTGWCFLENTNSPDIEVFVKRTYFGTSPSMGTIDASDAEIDAIQFVVVGGPLWSSGLIHLVGYR